MTQTVKDGSMTKIHLFAVSVLLLALSVSSIAQETNEPVANKGEVGEVLVKGAVEFKADGYAVAEFKLTVKSMVWVRVDSSGEDDAAGNFLVRLVPTAELKKALAGEEFMTLTPFSSESVTNFESDWDWLGAGSYGLVVFAVDPQKNKGKKVQVEIRSETESDYKERVWFSPADVNLQKAANSRMADVTEKINQTQGRLQLLPWLGGLGFLVIVLVIFIVRARGRKARSNGAANNRAATE